MHGQWYGWRCVPRNEKTQEDDSMLLFRSTPWCAALLDDPTLTIFTAKTQRVYASHNNGDAFMKQTLATPSTIRSHVILHPTAPIGNTYPRVSEVLTIFALGPLLMGHADVAHGGLIATLLDEVMGYIININEEIEMEKNPAYKRKQIMALKLDLTYKKPVPAPGIVLGRASLVKTEGRKRYVKATLEDGQGLVLTEAEALFLRSKRDQESRGMQTYSEKHFVLYSRNHPVRS